jgi:uncharacterized coiled-coil protein SlyX
MIVPNGTNFIPRPADSVPLRKGSGHMQHTYGSSGAPHTHDPIDELETQTLLQSQLEADTKVKTLQLRISGQLQTIRVLESQLSETQTTLALRNQQLARSESRIKVLEPKERERAALLSKSKLKEEQGQFIARAEETIEKYRVRSIFPLIISYYFPSCIFARLLGHKYIKQY